MAIARNWPKTLWKSSFKGVPFFVEQDREAGGRRVVIHEKPMSDDPFLEDLGESKREFEVTAYVASDTADSQATALVAVCAARGPGILVLPTQGPVNVRCLDFGRAMEKDRLGYIAFRLNFVREGAGSALASVAMLANQIFVAADAAAVALASAFVANIQVALLPDFVVAAAADGAQNAASTLEVIRTTEPVDPAVSATQRNEIQAIFDAAPNLIADPVNVSTLPTRIVAVARALADAMPARSAVAAFEPIVSDPALNVTIPTAGSSRASPYPTQFRRIAALNDAAAKQMLLLSAVTAYCEAIAQLTLTDRPSAVTLRANVAEYVEAILENIPAGQIDLFRAIASLRDSVVSYLSRSIINLAPVVKVEANLTKPSLYWSWRLYADPNRSGDLVARNLVSHPSFMPTTFEALSK